MPSLRDGGRRDIPWDYPIEPLDDERRDKLVHAWHWRQEQEHLAVGAFSELTRDLVEIGCHNIVLALVTRAAADEVRHADICRRVAELHLGKPLPSALKGAPEQGNYGGATREDEVLYRVVAMCCLSETMTGAYFTEMLEHATHPIARAVVQSLLEDEIDHGRLGWAHLANVKSTGGAQTLHEALPDLLEVTVKPVFDEAQEAPEADDPILDQHGYLGRTRGAAIYRRTLNDVILPGFESLGINTERARARIQSWS
jgi:hypothetical protein